MRTRCGAVCPCASLCNRWRMRCSPVPCLFSELFAAVCRSPFRSNHGMNQTLPVPLLITYSFSSRWWLAHISPSPSEKSVPTASLRGPASALCLVRATQVQAVKMCTHRSTIGLKGWVPGGLGAVDGGENLCRLSLHKLGQQGR